MDTNLVIMVAGDGAIVKRTLSEGNLHKSEGRALGPVEKGFRSVTLSEAKSPAKSDSSSAAGGLRMTDPGERRFSTDPLARRPRLASPKAGLLVIKDVVGAVRGLPAAAM